MTEVWTVKASKILSYFYRIIIQDGALNAALPKINKRLAASGSTYTGMCGILLLIV